MSALENGKLTYLDLTHTLNEYNELHAVNAHLQKASREDVARLRGTLEELKTHIAKNQQTYLLTNFSVEDATFRIKVLTWTGIIVGIFSLAAIAVASGKVPPARVKAVVMLCACVTVLYLIVLIVLAAKHSDRRRTAFGQFYWSGSKVPKA